MNLSVSVNASLPGIEAILTACKGGGLNAPEFDAMRKQWTVRYESFVRRRFDAYGRGGGDWPALALSTVEARRGPARGRKGKGGGSGGGRGARSSLARDTQRGGRLVSAGGTVTILADTGLLRGALTVGAVGNYSGAIPNGIEFGFDGTPHAEKNAAAASILSRALLAESVRGGLSAKSYKRIRKAGIAARGDAIRFTRRARSNKSATIAQIAGWHNTGTARMPQRLILAAPDEQTARGMANDFTRAILAIGRKAAMAAGGQR